MINSPASLPCYHPQVEPKEARLEQQKTSALKQIVESSMKEDEIT